MQKATVFEFSSITPNWSKKNISFEYTVFFDDGKKQVFTEEIGLPAIPYVVHHDSEAVVTALQTLHLVIGVSYYKLYCPETITAPLYKLSGKQASFWNTLYTKGLGEFFYQNKIDFRGLIKFPVHTHPPKIEHGYHKKSGQSLVLIGGGKDSLVTGELVKKAGHKITALYSHPIQERSLEILGISGLKFSRKLDPQLFELNNLPYTQNGHVPITALLSLLGVLCAVLYGYDNVILSNERSANYGNVEYLGEEINHQWSKSFECEKLISEYISSYVCPAVTYFSLMRPFYEIKIVKIFTQFPQYFPVFASCNRNFKQQNDGSKKWCGECPKCAFVFALLSAYVPKKMLVEIFGKDLYDDFSLLETYKELLGVVNSKPFECVGTPQETRYALHEAYSWGEYAQTPVMKYFTQEILPTIKDVETLEKDVLSYGDDSNIPDEFKKIVKEYAH